MSNPHTDLVNAIHLAIGARPDCRAFVMNVGVARDPNTGQVVKFNTRGMGDILALVGGKYLWIEAKTGKAVQNANQRKFMAMVHALAGPAHYIVARSVEDAVAAVEALA